MTLQAVAGWLGQTGLQHPASLYRNMLAAIVGRRSGFFRYNDFTLTPSASTMQLTIGRGDAFLMGTEGVTTQGGYFVWNNANETLAFPAAVSLPRVDSLILRVIDTDYGSDPAGSKAVWEIVSGTPAASPTAVPDSAFAVAGAYYHPGAWMRVADFAVPASATNLAAAPITYFTTFTRQGRAMIVNDVFQEPSDPQRGDLVQYLNGNHAGIVANYTGTGWSPVGWTDWQTWNPIVRNNTLSGTPATIASTTDHARFKRIGDAVFWELVVTVNAAVSNGASISLPVVATTVRTHNCGSLVAFGGSPPSGQMGIAYQVAAPGASSNWDRIVTVSANTLFLDWASGTVVRGQGFYYAQK